MLRRGLLILLASCGGGPIAAAAGAAPLVRLTLLDGAATVLVGARAYQAVEGLPLPDGTLIDTDPQCQLLRLEWADGSALDLGPGSRLMLAPPAAAGGTATAFYLLGGWAKFSRPAARQGWSSPLLDAAAAAGVTVLQVDTVFTQLFAEAGEQPVADRASGRRHLLKAGELVRVGPGHPLELMPKPSAAWLARLPRAFKDTLPRRFERFEGREVAAVPVAAPSYAALQPWLVAEPAIRRDFPQRFSARLAERDFRAALSANLRQHPEWAPLLGAKAPTGDKR